MDFLDLDVDQFRLVFQVAKELPNIPDAEMSYVGFTGSDAKALFNALARIRDNLEGAVLVRIHLGGDEPLCRVALIGVAARPLDLLIRRDLFIKWHVVLSEVLTYLGGEELYLRTGYEEREIRAAIEKLRTLQA